MSHLTRWLLHFLLALRNATACVYDCSTAFPQDSDGSPSLLGFFLVPLEEKFSSLACTFESLKCVLKCQCPGLTCRDLI